MINESIFKAYDIRGTYPDQLDEDLARDIGRAFVNHLGLPGSRVVVARDMRLSGEDLQAAFIEGVTEAGADVLSLGMVSTDALYFAVGHLEEPGGAMITASHNPKNYNGFKLCREKAIALSGESGIGEIRDLITSGKLPEPAEYPGSVEEMDIAEDYAEHCLGFTETEGLRQPQTGGAAGRVPRRCRGDGRRERLRRALRGVYRDGGPEAAQDSGRRRQRHGGQDAP